MILRELSSQTLKTRLANGGLRVRTGPFVTRIRSGRDEVLEGLALHYAEHPVEAENGFADFHVAIVPPRNVRRWLKPQIAFEFDGATPFFPLPADQAFAMLEWGLNWCVHFHCHQYLIVHAAVVEQAGRALLLPGPPGSGKSTLCAGLVNRGWRLLSDELALLNFETGGVVPLPRPVSLKNASIDVIRRFAPDAVLGASVHDTGKGSVAYMRPPVDAVRRANETARPRWIVLPRYAQGTALRLTPLSKATTFMNLADQSFNYDVHGQRGFEFLADVVTGSDCFELEYGDLEAAIARLSELAQQG